MTVFRILPNGARRRLPGGSVRALGANGPRYFDVSGSTSLGVDAGGAALPVVPMVGQAWLSFALAGSLTQAGTIGRTVLSIGVAGALSGSVNLRGVSLLGIDVLGTLTPAQRMRGSVGVQFVAAGRLLPSVPMRGVTGVGVDVIGQLAVAAALRGRLNLGIRVSGLLTAKAGQKWRDLWRNAYDKRQAVLNAIDANNRSLAKDAGVLAGATATALVQTNTRVEEVDDKVIADAQRVTVLTGRVGNVEGTQSAQGLAMQNMQTTQTSQGNTLISHSQQFVNVQASLTDLNGKTTTLANANQSLDARVSVNELGVAQAKATWGVYLTAGNVISGVQSINNGIVAEFNVMAHVFRLLSPAGADGMEIQDGYIRIWKGNSQTIIGNKFGVAGQGLMKWFGPNIGAAACTKANATSWEDDQGNAYFGGSLSAGVLRNGAQSTQVGPNAVVETGQFGTNGGAKTVTYSLSYSNYFITQTNLGGNGTLNATMVLERSIGGGAWGEVSRRALVGSKTFIEYEAGVGYSYSFSIGGSSTFTDNTAGSSSTFNYRVRLEGVTGWPYAKPEGGASPWGRQSLTVLSIEE